MSHFDPKVRRSLINLFKAHGFTKRNTCFYRCTNDGLLQVIKIPGNGVLSRYVFSNGIHFSIYSLYAELNWIDSKLAYHILQTDLPVTLDAEDVFFTEKTQTLGHHKNYQCIAEEVIRSLSLIETHCQLASFMEENDIKSFSCLRWNDSNKIIPYVLSGQLEKATKCIDAIEHQNWSAYFANSENSGYDREKHKQRIESNLSSLIRLRNQITYRNQDGIQEYLQNNYLINSQKLKKMRVF